MNGPQDPRLSPCAQNVKAHIGRRRPKKIRVIVYGLFDSKGRCRYVGQTIRERRRGEHRLIRGRKSFRFKVLETLLDNADSAEQRWIAKYQAIGQCDLNKGMTKVKRPHTSPWNRKVLYSKTGETFPSIAEAARQLNLCQQSLRQWARESRNKFSFIP